jgi:N-carbamoyl-L-amino-acid hydrolase
MDRRQFNLSVLGALGAGLGSGRTTESSELERKINAQRVLGQLGRLAAFGKDGAGGVTRVAYGEANRQGRVYVMGLMREAGLDVHVDLAGNIVGRTRFGDPGRAPLCLGSHIDSVPQGGRFDGALGSLGAIEVARFLTDNGIATKHPLEVIVFQNEEGGKTGSRALATELRDRDLDRLTNSGKTIREGTRFLGGDPDRLDRARRQPGDIAAFVELHIEQGGLLEKEAIDIGIVEGIVGIKRWYVEVEGFANHAGTTPMNDRRDALLGAAGFVQAVNRVVREAPGRSVGTVGQIEAFPGAPNVVPGRVRMSLEIRDLEMAKIERLFEEIRAEATEIASASGTRITFDEFYVSEAAPTAERLRHCVEDSVAELGLSGLRMPSGAGHDAQSMAKVGPVGMIFIPSVGGISHSPRELSRDADVVAGVNVLLHTILKADARL